LFFRAGVDFCGTTLQKHTPPNMNIVFGGIILVRRNNDKLQMAYHTTSRPQKIFLRSPMACGASFDERVADAIFVFNETFGVALDTSVVVPMLSFYEPLKNPNTCSEHHVAILGEGFETNNDRVYSTVWVDVDEILNMQWPWYRALFVKQLSTVLQIYQKHYNILKRRTLEDAETAFSLEDVHNTSLTARRIVVESGRLDLLFFATVVTLQHEICCAPTAAETCLFSLVTEFKECNNLLAASAVDHAWFAEFDRRVTCFDKMHCSMFSSSANTWKANMYRKAALLLTTNLKK
jgi:hypothetical protein